jgi:Concanavalin A-like lectin/glucanases superfamily
MSDLRSQMQRAADRHHPPDEWLDHIHERVRTKRRIQRVSVGIVALGVFVAVTAVFIRQLTTEEAGRPGGAPSPAGVRCSVEPTAWWSGDGSGVDVAGGNDAILRGDTAFVDGLVGGAFRLDGQGDWLEIPDAPTIEVGSRDFTVSMWVRYRSTRGEQVFAEEWIETYEQRSQEGWALTKLRNNVIGFGFSRAGGIDTKPLDLPTHTWIQVVARRMAGTMSIFVNGTLVASAEMTNPDKVADSMATLKFGHRGSPDDTPGSRDRRGFFLNGEVDEIQLFIGRGLSDADIERVFRARSACAM